jgi:hypothetical protein
MKVIEWESIIDSFQSMRVIEWESMIDSFQSMRIIEWELMIDSFQSMKVVSFSQWELLISVNENQNSDQSESDMWAEWLTLVDQWESIIHHSKRKVLTKIFLLIVSVLFSWSWSCTCSRYFYSSFHLNISHSAESYLKQADQNPRFWLRNQSISSNSQSKKSIDFL